MKKLINYLYEPLKKNKNIVVFEIIIFTLGLTLGSFFITFINKNDKNILLRQISEYFLNIKSLSKNVFGLSAFKDILFNNLFQVLIIFFLGISMIGVIVIIFILFFKGFTLGVTLSSIILKYKLKGVLYLLFYIFPSNIISIITYIFICYYGISAAIKIIKVSIKKGDLKFKVFFGKYTLSFLISIFVIILSSFLEGYLTPLLLKFLTGIFKM